MNVDVGTIFIDSRHAAKLAKSDMFGVLDFLEAVSVSEDNVSLKMKSVICLNEEWIPCHNWSEKIELKKEDIPSYIKNDRFISGAVWVPIENKYTDLIDLLNEKKIKSVDFHKELVNEIYSDSIKNVNTILEPLGKFL